jgi:periplasmic divalent cation tolerance protein
MVTAPDRKTARALAKAALKARLVACANLVGGIESHYWWRSKLESSAEVLILFKTLRHQLNDLEQFILSHHPYDTPEIVAIDLGRSNHRYLEWVRQSVAEKPRPKR